MVGAKIPVLETQNLFISDDGRGLIVYNDGTNFYKGRVWTGVVVSGATTTNLRPKLFPAASSSGWLKIHVISGGAAAATYGATGQTYYIPFYSNLDTNLST
jgi:hypothetical protein